MRVSRPELGLPFEAGSREKREQPAPRFPGEPFPQENARVVYTARQFG